MLNLDFLVDFSDAINKKIMIGGSMKLWSNPNIRMYVPTDNSGKWRLLSLDTKKEYDVSSEVCLLISSFIEGNEVDEAENELKSILKKKEIDLSGAILWLISNGFLIESEAEYLEKMKLIELWHDNGWFESLDYHLLTFNYPFENYSLDGDSNDIDVMHEYRMLDIEPSRTKLFENTLLAISAPTSREACSKLTIDTLTIFSGSMLKNGLDKDRLLQLAAITFGKLRHRKVISGKKVEDLIRKTSPSGGCRHPSEGYFFCVDVIGIEPGCYHFSVSKNALIKVADLPTTEEMNIHFDGLNRSDFKPKAYAVMTSIFGRNMFRYREPRTFRTPFMDIGHLIATMELTAQGLGISTYTHHGINDEFIESILRINCLDESVVYGVALG